MRNPSRTLQNSIFEPLYSHQEELHFQPNLPNTQSSSSSSSSSDSWLSLNAPSSIAPLSSYTATMKRGSAAATIFNENISGRDSSVNAMATEFACSVMATEHAHTHELPSPCNRGMCSPSGSASVIMPTSPPIRSHSTSDVVNPDDGSVASKLLSSITKSISSPSLLACCKESARETPYQKSLRLRTMKLQYCAEELGSESSEGSLHGGDYFSNNIFDSLNNYKSSSQSSRDFSAEFQKEEGSSASSKLISVRSSPNLGCSTLVSKPTSHIKERSFPPPLSHTLPRSSSLDSFSYSLRASREDGRFVLKEFKVPCRQYFHASRKDGRLTLQCLTGTDEDSAESMPTTDEAHIKEGRDLQEDDNVGVCAGASGDVGASNKAKDGSSDKIEVESAKNTANLVVGLEGCRVKGTKKSVDDTDEENNMKEAAGCLYAECFLMSKTSSNGNSYSAKINDKANFMPLGAASSKMKSDFKAAKRKTTSKASRICSPSRRHLLSSSSNRQSLLHLPGKSPNLKLGDDSDATKLSQCAANSGLESKSTSGVSVGVGKTLQGFEITPGSLGKSGCTIGKGPSSTVIFKDVNAKCLMENVSKLVASFGLEYGEEKELDKNYCYNGGIMESSMYKGIKSINIGVREIESGCSHELIRGVLLDVMSRKCGFRCGAFREGECDVDDDSTRSCLPNSSLHFGVEIPPSSTDSRAAPRSPSPLQGTEWLHTLHCKEIFHRNLAKGAFMKLHCVA